MQRSVFKKLNLFKEWLIKENNFSTALSGFFSFYKYAMS
jgi:hypothetical protein